MTLQQLHEFWQRNVVRICVLIALVALIGAFVAAQRDNDRTREVVHSINVVLCRQQVEDRETVRNVMELALFAQAASGQGVSRELLTVAEGIRRAYREPPVACEGLNVAYSNPPVVTPNP